MRRFQGTKGINPALAKVNQKQAVNQAISASGTVNMLLTLTVLHDKFGFGTKRIEKFLAEYHELLDSHDKGYISPDDLNDVLKEEVGVSVYDKRTLQGLQ